MREPLSDEELVYCDTVLIGTIGLNKHGQYVGHYTDGRYVQTSYQRPTVYRALRSWAWYDKKLVRVRKGLYRANPHYHG